MPQKGFQLLYKRFRSGLYLCIKSLLTNTVKLMCVWFCFCGQICSETILRLRRLGAVKHSFQGWDSQGKRFPTCLALSAPSYCSFTSDCLLSCCSVLTWVSELICRSESLLAGGLMAQSTFPFSSHLLLKFQVSSEAITGVKSLLDGMRAWLSACVLEHL